MNILRELRTVALASAVLSLLSLQAQTTKEGYALTWNGTITVVHDSIVNGKHKLPAYTFAVFESNGADALALWKTDMRTKCKEVMGSKPTKAVGSMFPTLSIAPILVVAQGRTDKKAKAGKLTVAFAENDSVPVMEQAAAEQAAREMAVLLNKAVVQKQLDTYSKMFDRTSDKLTTARSDVAKNQKDINKANADLGKRKNAVSRIQADNAKRYGEIMGLEKKFAITNAPKDLERLTKARQKLANGETELAKAMKSEAKAQEAVTKYQSTSTDRSSTQDQQAQNKSDIERTIADLERKQDAIR